MMISGTWSKSRVSGTSPMRAAVALGAAFALSLGLSACGGSSDSQVSRGDAATSSAAAAQGVDVVAIWDTTPMPDCPNPILIENLTQGADDTVPTKASVRAELDGAESPADATWVKTKLGWVTQSLAQVRAGAANRPGTPGVKAMITQFDSYVVHVREELEAGHDIDSDLDYAFPETCR